MCPRNGTISNHAMPLLALRQNPRPVCYDHNDLLFLAPHAIPGRLTILMNKNELQFFSLTLKILKLITCEHMFYLKCNCEIKDMCCTPIPTSVNNIFLLTKLNLPCLNANSCLFLTFKL